MPTTPKATTKVVRKKNENPDKVAGKCPMGCGETLFLDMNGRVTCSFVECPDPTIVDQILDEDARERDHVAEIYNGVLTIRHPLWERVDDRLTDCDLHRWLNQRIETLPPLEDGTYRFTYDDEKLTWRYVNTIT